ncbi:MAG: cbb3-type cytochrome c oxidase subunit 3 [Phycisphaeraceae bacterium]|nr:cbb3-type cytochrome c oxidase subunit 3 [Phycisphaeraceae bacterium]
MSLTEIMHHADLSLYPKVGLLIFLGVFLLVCYRTIRMNRSMDLEHAAHLALEDDAPPATSNPASNPASNTGSSR